jgi:hypothetical protein
VTRALLLLLSLVAAGCSGVDPCAGVAGACLAVHVTSASVREVDRLDVAVTVGAVHGSATTAGAGPTALPAVTAIELGPSITAPVDIRIAVDAERGGAVVGHGAAATVIAPAQHASLEVRLGAAVDGGSADLAGPGCVAGGLYCGGDKLDGDPGTLYRCDAPAAPTVRGVCASGCILRPGLDDACRGGGGVCSVGGFYCGGDKLDGDPQTLYKCQAGGTGTVSRTCPNGCQVNAGTDDACK